ncbi:hypothetical protein X739_26175 [Mesorhizobium sp. LNHC220B00]|nr:hypothetical protein X739_26175 [Mesorhizobium sp. LNHC220B00]
MLWFLGIASYFPIRDSRSRPAARMPAPVSNQGQASELA